MVMPGRNFNAGNYRYGFNGKENDNEVKGVGDQQDYGMRIYDPRLGRFLSVDPLSGSYPWNSTYAFAENNVIQSIDLDGGESDQAVLKLFLMDPSPLLKKMASAKKSVDDGKKLFITLAAASMFETPLSRSLIFHYAYGGGSPVLLNEKQMATIHSAKFGLDGNGPVGASQFRSHVLFKAKPGKTIDVNYSILTSAKTAGTLGRYTAEFKGKVTFDKKDPSKWSFEGKMRFIDEWNFETETPDGKFEDADRTPTGDQQTQWGKKYLIGKTFAIKSVWVPVKQTSDDSYFDWFDDKSDKIIQSLPAKNPELKRLLEAINKAMGEYNNDHPLDAATTEANINVKEGTKK